MKKYNFEQIKQKTLTITQDLKKKAREKGFLRTMFGIPLQQVLREQNRFEIFDLTPRLLSRSVDYIEKHLDEVGIYRLSGSTKDVQELKFKYEQDLDIQFEYEDVNSVCSLLKNFIRELPEPLLTHALTPDFNRIFNHLNDEAAIITNDITLESKHTLVNNSSILEALKRLIDRLPAPNRDFLAVFLAHLKKIAENYKRNKMGYSNLQVVFAPTLHFGGSLFVVLTLHCQKLFPIEKSVQAIELRSEMLIRRRRPSEPQVDSIRRRPSLGEDPFGDNFQSSPPPRKYPAGNSSPVHVPTRSDSRSAVQSSPTKIGSPPWKSAGTVTSSDRTNLLTESPPKGRSTSPFIDDFGSFIPRSPEPLPQRQESIGLLGIFTESKPSLPPRPTLVQNLEQSVSMSFLNEHYMLNDSAGTNYSILDYNRSSSGETNPFDDPAPPVPEKDIPFYEIQLATLPNIRLGSPFPDFDNFTVESADSEPPSKPPRNRP
jgi:hypothetical protein